MAVKIEHTVGGHNHDILQQCISDVYTTSSGVTIAKIFEGLEGGGSGIL